MISPTVRTSRSSFLSSPAIGRAAALASTREIVWTQLDLDGNGAGGGCGRLWLAGVGEPCEERRQLATDDLRRRPPKGLEADGGCPAMAAAHVLP
jgi:hypothetical protein